jgi:hypothetical protein
MRQSKTEKMGGSIPGKLFGSSEVGKHDFISTLFYLDCLGVLRSQ